MSIVSKQVNIVTSVDNVLSVVVKAVTDMKAGKTPSQTVEDVGPAFVAALASLSDLKNDLSDHVDLETTVALKAAELVNVFIP